mmetsp:Transcript_19829/g.56783  ORF Transcript_19829/g.56783 Transcript_19829/m.56783 type:complete len:92 (-) Transcript_19829:138-413(-)
MMRDSSRSRAAQEFGPDLNLRRVLVVACRPPLARIEILELLQSRSCGICEVVESCGHKPMSNVAPLIRSLAPGVAGCASSVLALATLVRAM